MSEEQDGENEDYDREDIEHVENMLYANIHYDSGSTSIENRPIGSTSTQNDYVMSGSSGGNREPDAEQNNGSRRNAKRYWSNNTPNTSNATKYVPFFKEKQSGIYKQTKPIGDAPKENAPSTPNNDQNTTPKAITPKQFTPYVSFLPFNDSISNIGDEQLPVASTSNDESSAKVLKTTNEMVRKSLATKHINPFSKKHTIDEYKSMFSEDAIESESIGKQTAENKKRLNPFNPLSRKAKRKKSEPNQDQNQTKSVRKSRAELKKEAAVAAIEAKKTADSNIIDIDDDKDDDDDDDVIILPTQAPPLICVDDSDDDLTPSNTQEHAFTEPNAVAESRRKATRCASPSSSIQSADDFIGQNDQRNFGFETFGTMSDDDLCQVNETTENNSSKQTKQIGTSRRTIPTEDDNAIFTPPKQMQKDKTKSTTSIAKKSYEVGANSFTAVDVYESESSDMPDSIYAKGTANKRKQLSDSDSSSVESLQITKSKRLRKRKSSGSAKESDIHSEDSSSDLPEDDDTDDDDDDDNAPNEGYLVRGEALGKVKNINKKKKNSLKMNRNTNDKRSEDDFINKLSSIVHGQNDSDDNDEIESTQETSTESVAARDIVESVLQRRTKKSKKNHTVEIEATADANANAIVEANTNANANSDANVDTNQTETATEKAWAVTDQVGETDDLNLGRIFEESAFDASNINDSNQAEPQGTNQSNQQNQEQQSNEPSASNNLNQPVEQNECMADEDECENDSDDHMFKTEIGWNDEMRRFYNDSWGGETFSSRNIRARMPKSILSWSISNRDKSALLDNRRQIRCLNCQEKGHRAKFCPRPPATKRCYMCGIEGHLEPRCPFKICLTCGRKSQKFTNGCGDCSRDREIMCYVCRRKGHRQILCPDRWRRYHSTTKLNQELIPAPTNLPAKPKFCCVCAQRGHLAENCNRANRSVAMSVNVSSYRPLLHAKNEVQNTGPKCTILTSDINDFSFNFGNDVLKTGNSIYARFRRAVNLNTDHNKSGVSENDVMFVSESNLHDVSEPPIEVYDDFDFDNSIYDNISSSDQCFSADSSFMTVDNVSAESTLVNESNEAKMDNDSLNVTDPEAENPEAEIQELDKKMKTLSDLKEKMLSYKTNMDQSTNENDSIADGDINISGQKNDVTTSSALADFIPLTSDEPERYEPTRSPSPVSADSTTQSNEKTDATIHLTPEHAKHLVSEKGIQFLRKREQQLNISVSLEWRNYGNVLVVKGLTAGQADFHNELKTFFQQTNETVKPSYISCWTNLPKNRDALIKYIRNQVILLDTPICNNKHVADVQTLYSRICSNQTKPSKANMRQISKLRRHLNMVLFGRYGFADGRTHLNALQACLRDVIKCQTAKISANLRKEIVQHIDYIFSDIDHENYPPIIERYNTLKKEKSLPPLIIDRKLFGLKINAYDPNHTENEHTPRGNTSRRRSFSRNIQNTSSNRNSSSSNAHFENNRQNALPSSVDIQINVSTPSNSYQNHGHSNESRNTGCVYQGGRILDKWKY